MPSTKLGVRVTVVGLPASSEGASGAAVATSAAYTRTPGAIARTAEAIPQESPPPPNGTTIASASGRSSRISRPIVPFPAMTSASLNACTKTPSRPS